MNPEIGIGGVLEVHHPGILPPSPLFSSFNPWLLCPFSPLSEVYGLMSAFKLILRSLTTLPKKLYDTEEIKSTEKRVKFVSEDKCFVCGGDNPDGLRLEFEIDREKQTLKTRFIAKPVFQGYDAIVHGGIISTLLDEAMAKLAYELGYNAVTATLEVRFKKPAPILEPLLVYGEITEVNQRLVKAKSRVAKEDGTVLATATSTLVKQSPSRPGSP